MPCEERVCEASDAPYSQANTRLTTDLGYRRDIDGLRALAVLSVVLYHIFPTLLPGGFVGVDVFFVISGFLISRILWDSLAKGTFSYLDFYRRRVLRIFPALAIVLLFTWIAGQQLMYWDEFARLGKHSFSGAFFVSNFTLWHEGGYFDVVSERKPLLHLWSLSIEEQFYLIWPLALAFFWHRRLPFLWISAGLGVASLGLSIFLTASDPIAAFYNPLSRFWELLLGATVGHVARGRSYLSGSRAHAASVTGLALLGGSFVLFDRSMLFPGALALVPAVGTSLFLLCHPASSLNRLILGRNVLVGIGLISYPLYLWHWSLFSITYMRMHAGIPTVLRCVIVIASLILAWCTYILLELPIQRSKHKKWLAGILLILIFSLGLLGYATDAMNGFVKSSFLGKTPRFLSEKRLIDSWLKDVRNGSCHIQSHEVATHPTTCVEDARPLVFIWGDSYASALYPGFYDLQKKEPFGLAQLTSAGCPPLPGIHSNVRKNCDDINQNVLRTVMGSKPEILILAAAWRNPNYPLSNEEILAKISTQIQMLKTALPHTKIVVIGPMFRWDPDLPQILAEFVLASGNVPPLYLPIPDTPENKLIRELDLEMMSKTVSTSGVIYISPKEYFCNGELCLTRLNDSPEGLVVVDNGHLNPPAARYLVSQLANKILP